QQLASSGWRSTIIAPAATTEAAATEPATTDIPLPRSRPAGADIHVAVDNTVPAMRPDDRSMLQKFSDLLPGKLTLASLTPNSGLFRRGPDLAALVYDISARAVYLPNGLSLEAHSGLGQLRDDPEHVDQRMVGATPPATYELKP